MEDVIELSNIPEIQRKAKKTLVKASKKLARKRDISQADVIRRVSQAVTEAREVNCLGYISKG